MIKNSADKLMPADMNVCVLIATAEREKPENVHQRNHKSKKRKSKTGHQRDHQSEGTKLVPKLRAGFKGERTLQ